MAEPRRRRTDEDLGAEHMLVNIGPQHPATHGVLRLVLELEGETVQRCIPHIGYLHSGFEKLGEYRHYNQIIPLTDRTDYLSPMANNVCLALAAEKLMGIEMTERCQVLRVIACEMSRIISHLVWLGTTGIDLGAFTPFLWSFQERERIYNLQEAWTGARLTTSLTRVGGMMADIPDGWEAGLREFCRHLSRRRSTEVDTMFTRNAIWIGRTQGVGRPDGARRRSTTRSPGRCSGPAGWTTTSARTGPTWGTRPTTSMCRWASTATSTIATGCGWRRCTSRPGSWSRRSTGWPAQGRADQRRRSARDPAAQVARDERHGSDDLPLQAGDGRGQAAGRARPTWGSKTPRASWATTSCPTAPPSRCAGGSGPPSFINLACLPTLCEGALLSDVIAINASVDIVMGEVDR